MRASKRYKRKSLLLLVKKIGHLPIQERIKSWNKGVYKLLTSGCIANIIIVIALIASIVKILDYFHITPPQHQATYTLSYTTTLSPTYTPIYTFTLLPTFTPTYTATTTLTPTSTLAPGPGEDFENNCISLSNWTPWISLNTIPPPSTPNNCWDLKSYKIDAAEGKLHIYIDSPSIISRMLFTSLLDFQTNGKYKADITFVITINEYSTYPGINSDLVIGVGNPDNWLGSGNNDLIYRAYDNNEPMAVLFNTQIGGGNYIIFPGYDIHHSPAQYAGVSQQVKISIDEPYYSIALNNTPNNQENLQTVLYRQKLSSYDNLSVWIGYHIQLQGSIDAYISDFRITK